MDLKNPCLDHAHLYKSIAELLRDQITRGRVTEMDVQPLQRILVLEDEAPDVIVSEHILPKLKSELQQVVKPNESLI